MSSRIEPAASLPSPVDERAQWLSPRVAFVPTQRSFPSSHALLLTDGDELALVDAGLDDEALQALAPRLDELFVTHFHLDHVAGIDALRGVPLTWNASETGALSPDVDGILDFLEVPGPVRGPVGEFLDNVYPSVPGPARTVEPGASLDLAGVRVDTIPVPGHSPGHLALEVPEAGVVFTVDVEFRGRGPWYGWPHCDPTPFELAAAKLAPRLRDAEVVTTSHSDPIRDTERAVERLETFVDVFEERDAALLEALKARGDEGASVGELVDEVRIFYGKHLDAREHLRMFCRVMTQLHLERLAEEERARRAEDGWRSMS